MRWPARSNVSSGPATGRRRPKLALTARSIASAEATPSPHRATASRHWVPEMVELVGGTNLLTEKGQPSRQVTWRQIRDATPEVVVYMPCGYYLEEAEEEALRLYGNPEFADTPAAREGNVFAVDATSYFSRPGPRIVDGLEIMAWAVHPEAYREPPAHAIVRVRR